MWEAFWLDSFNVKWDMFPKSSIITCKQGTCWPTVSSWSARSPRRPEPLATSAYVGKMTRCGSHFRIGSTPHRPPGGSGRKIEERTSLRNQDTLWITITFNSILTVRGISIPRSRPVAICRLLNDVIMMLYSSPCTGINLIGPSNALPNAVASLGAWIEVRTAFKE